MRGRRDIDRHLLEYTQADKREGMFNFKGDCQRIADRQSHLRLVQARWLFVDLFPEYSRPLSFFNVQLG